MTTRRYCPVCGTSYRPHGRRTFAVALIRAGHGLLRTYGAPVMWALTLRGKDRQP